MNNYAIFIAAYWLYLDEGGHNGHFSDADSAFRSHEAGATDYRFLQPFYDRVEAKCVCFSNTLSVDKGCTCKACQGGCSGPCRKTL